LSLLYPLMLDGIGDCKDANRLDKLMMEHLDKFLKTTKRSVDCCVGLCITRNCAQRTIYLN
jgi:hypothetical protein